MNTKLLRQLALGMAIGTALAACDRDTKDVAVAPPPAPRADESARQAPTPVPPGTQNPATSITPATPTEPANPSTNLPDSSSVGAPERPPLPAEEKREQEAQPTPGTPETKPEIRQERGAAPGTASPLAEGDRAFVIAAISDGMAAMQAARLAASKGANPNVKAFAEHLRVEHSNANLVLGEMARNKGLTVSESIPEKDSARLDELRQLSGAELDAAFLHHFGTAGHEETIDLFERQLRDGIDADLRAFAGETLVALRRHLQIARDLQDELKTVVALGAAPVRADRG
jgi:putative membrane protein